MAFDSCEVERSAVRQQEKLGLVQTPDIPAGRPTELTDSSETFRKPACRQTAMSPVQGHDLQLRAEAAPSQWPHRFCGCDAAEAPRICLFASTDTMKNRAPVRNRGVRIASPSATRRNVFAPK